jgi:hypothetical protein
MTTPASLRPTVRIVAILMGFPCAVLIALMADVVRANPRWEDAPSGWTLLLVLAIGWTFATWLLLRRVDGLVGVIRRGFMFGVVAWLVIGVLVSILGRVAPAPARQGVFQENASWEPAAPAIVSRAAGATFMGSATTAMAALCLLGWTVAFIGGRVYERHGARVSKSKDAPAAVRPG